jgi:hypothetical protein
MRSYFYSIVFALPAAFLALCSAVHAEGLSLALHATRVSRPAATCATPEPFLVSIKLNKKRRTAVLAHQRRRLSPGGIASFRKQSLENGIGRIIIARLRGGRMVVQERAVSLEGSDACSFTFRSLPPL